MNILFIHQNYPAQFGRLAEALASRNVVVAIGVGERSANQIGRVSYYSYRQFASPLEPAFPPLEHLTEHVRRGRAVADLLLQLKGRGFQPDIVIAHPAWGEALFVRDIYPNARFVAYLEYFYQDADADLDFDPEFPTPRSDLPYVRFKNVTGLLAHASADLCITATKWQAGTFPTSLRRSLTVLHDGIDTTVAAPDASARLLLPDGRELSRDDEVVTFVSRSLEPYRGFHVFMRALPDLLRRRPGVTVVVVGGDDVSYGLSPERGQTWRQKIIEELSDELDLSRVVFLGRVPYSTYLEVLRVSTVHVYLTYPFVLSWSLLEAMATGCAVVASSTGPVIDVVVDRENGRLCGFFDRTDLAGLVDELLDDPTQRSRLGEAARATVVGSYDFSTRILPRYRRFLRELVRNDKSIDP